jgi:hypothetical protein
VTGTQPPARHPKAHRPASRSARTSGSTSRSKDVKVHPAKVQVTLARAGGEVSMFGECRQADE